MFDTSTLQGGWYIAMGARAFRVGPADEIGLIDWDNLLELRAFTSEHEIKWVCGQVRDSADIPQPYITREEEHYLDIDTSKHSAKPGHVFAIGGGEYRLPDPTPEKLKIQIYYRADDKGFFQPFDFRIVDFIGKAVI